MSTNWRTDVENAPKGRNPDGTLGIIVLCPYGSRWSAHHAWWNDHEEEWNDITGDYIVYPTHWMPLPPPPAKETK